ncbi:uncharacterized protein GGS22DRAFT_170690 [Annulohypoxylon maeteangense]|uniref:uncharacterized protein n=1 Tax=Annulohypoxylon maeteangense TaxID=1927788 RepID=UPI002007C0E4|nr:uncharacterized protein GGS22DRAFT_170690 [Annulohypoxylon maeteangense]KAI0882326.1 hypothetical protein GGS22DRAFT_170690 [Annulohypoxylon maeteangense]
MNFNESYEKPSTTWQDAVNSFLSSLGPTERVAFQTPASPDDCIAILLATQRRKTKLARILDLMRPVIDPLKRFEGAIDVIVQVNAGIASPIWGPLRIVITLSADHFRTLESIAMIIHRVISSLQRFSKYEELFENNQLVQDAIGTLYCDYLDFCVRVTKFYSTSPFRAFFSSFDKDFQDVSENIQLHSQNVDWAAHAAYIEETQREAEKAKAERRAHERSNILRWLSPSNVDDDLEIHMRDYLLHSCDDILISEQFQSLISSDDTGQSHILSLQGLPGSGKTTTAAFIVGHLKTKGFDVLYFFFKANDVEKCSLLHCTRTLLSQLIRLEEHLYDFVEPFYQESGRVVADSLTVVLRALSTALNHSKSNRIFVILDALDESSNSNEISQWITSLSHNRGRQVRILNTCRPSPSPPQSSTSWSLFRIGNLETESIKTYIHARVQKNPVIRDTAIGRQVSNHVASAAQGLWLYARLMMDDIDRLPSIGQIQKQLTILPKGFTELYTQIIRTTEANYNPIELKLAQQLHLWIDTSDYVPNFLVLDDDRLTYEMLELIFQYANSGEAVHDPGAVAHRVSGPLISVTSSTTASTPTSPDTQSYELDFIHQTAAQYLRSSHTLPPSQLPVTLRPRRLRHLHRAAVAVWYFAECAQSAEMLAYLRQSGGRPTRSIITYFEMAYGLWSALHLSTFPTIDDAVEASEAEALLHTLTEFISTPKCLRWVECAIIINYRGRFPHLLYNAVDGWEAARRVEGHGFAPWLAFSEARVRFFRNYALVLATTGVGRESTPREILETRLEEVMGDELAHAICYLGLRWRKLAFPGAGEVDLGLG